MPYKTGHTSFVIRQTLLNRHSHLLEIYQVKKVNELRQRLDKNTKLKKKLINSYNHMW